MKDINRPSADARRQPGSRVSRRKFLGGAAAAALPLVAASSTSASQDAKQEAKLTIGIATNRFIKHSNRQLAEELSQAGLKVVQLFLSQTDSRYWKYNGRADVSDLTAARCEAIANAYRSVGISIHSIAVYANLIHPDQAERQQNLAYFESMMKIARHMEVQTLITEAGHYQSEDAPARVEYHFQEEVWDTMVATGKKLAELAERHGVVVLMEPFFRGFLASAKRTRLFLEAVGSPRIRALLDPANLLEVNDLEEMFQQLKPWIGCLHAKDRKMHVDRGVAAGKGDLDYPQFVTLAAKHTPHAPLILEYVGAQDYQQALEHLRHAMRQAGLAGSR